MLIVLVDNVGVQTGEPEVVIRNNTGRWYHRFQTYHSARHHLRELRLRITRGVRLTILHIADWISAA